VALLGFAVPFFLLLMRRLKQSPAGLAWVASLLVAAQLASMAWVVVPAQENLTPAGGLLSASVAAGALALFANRFMSAARRSRRQA
jgi:hypothetical protein